MKFVLLVYQGTTPLPGSDRWQALSGTEQKAIYTDYAELNKTEGIAPGFRWDCLRRQGRFKCGTEKPTSRTGRIRRKVWAGSPCTRPTAWRLRLRWRRGSRRPGSAARWRSGRPRSTGDRFRGKAMKIKLTSVPAAMF